VFVKAGSIVPFGAEIQSTATKQGIASVKVYPGRDVSFDLYDDDGVSYDYEKGKGTTTRLHWNNGAGKLEASGGDANLAKNLSSIVKVVGK
jgi:alpha-D-xyloside xylohydrolase